MKQLINRLLDQDTVVKEGGGYTHIDKDKYKAYNKFRPEGPKALFCYVPFNNISFSFEGRVLACAYNQKVELGHYPEQSVRDMWFNSVEGQQLRDHLEHNDLSYGCKHCKYFFDNEKFSGLKPLVFDKYSDYKHHKYPRILEFELSNECNYECVMCNGKVSSSIRKNRDHLPPIPSPYGDEFVEELTEFIPHLDEAKFYGGEPFLIPVYFKIWDKMLELNPKIKIFVITNGSALNNRIKGILEKGNFDLAVSMDSMNKETLEGIRLNARQEVMLKHIDWFNDYCKRKKKNLVISFTLMRHNWRDFEDVVHYCNRIGAILYVSYLKTPPQFALWNLPAETLEEIYQAVKDVDFEANNYAERQNRQVYRDFQTYMVHAIETNRTRPEEEIIPLVPGQSPLEAIGLAPATGDDGKNNGTSNNNGTSKKQAIMTTPNQPGAEYNPDHDYRADINQQLTAIGRTDIVDRVSGIIDGMAEEFDHNRVFYEMLNSDQKGMVAYIDDSNDHQLVVDVKNIFGI